MADVRMNKVAKFNALVDMIAEGTVFEDGSDVREFLTHEAEVTAKRNSHKSSKPGKKQIENAEIAEKIKGVLAENGRMTATEIRDALGLSSTQKVSGVIKTSEGITATKDKRVTYYTLTTEE